MGLGRGVVRDLVGSKLEPSCALGFRVSALGFIGIRG